jgi:hypothetical protein
MCVAHRWSLGGGGCRGALASGLEEKLNRVGRGRGPKPGGERRRKKRRRAHAEEGRVWVELWPCLVPKSFVKWIL